MEMMKKLYVIRDRNNGNMFIDGTGRRRWHIREAYFYPTRQDAELAISVNNWPGGWVYEYEPLEKENDEDN